MQETGCNDTILRGTSWLQLEYRYLVLVPCFKRQRETREDSSVSDKDDKGHGMQLAQRKINGPKEVKFG